MAQRREIAVRVVVVHIESRRADVRAYCVEFKFNVLVGSTQPLKGSANDSC